MTPKCECELVFEHDEGAKIDQCKLCQAAPELYDACVGLLESLEKRCSKSVKEHDEDLIASGHDEIGCTICFARSAIKRAQGIIT